MSEKKRALITGVTGQDGSYLADLLLEKGYEVCGMVRRASVEKFERIEHLRPRLDLRQADLLDQLSLIELVKEFRPHEIYNLAAQSFVPTSWTQPMLTAEFDAVGVTRMLEAVRLVDPAIRFYQASSSEMFGKVREVPQRETTPFHPRSPYGVAKVYGHFITVNYRESYGIFACSGILFNHESVVNSTPVFVRRDGLIDLLPIEDVVPHEESRGTHQTTDLSRENRFETWDMGGWVEVTCMTAYRNDADENRGKQVRRIAARGAVYQATSDHVVFVARGEQAVEKPAAEVEPGERLALIDLPEPTNEIWMSEDKAWLLGILVAEGHVSREGKIVLTNQDEQLLDEVERRWRRCMGGTSSRYVARSGFPNGRPVTQLRLTGVARAYGRYLRESLYARSGQKRIPKVILNAPYDARLAFLQGFNAGDGLKSTPCTYEFQGFKTSSPVLASALYWLAVTTLKQRAIICTEEREGRLYYQINLNSPNVPGQKGQHLRRPLDEVLKAEPVEYRGWLFDLATTSGTFHAGVGQGWIHNSPRRGLEFVTRKVSWGAAQIKLGLASELRLGNLEARRDWGFAGDYVEAMWRMLQQPEPDDYVVATGENHSVRELVEIAFEHAGLDWKKFVKTDPSLLRPAEVDTLVGDSTKARTKLGWKPKVGFAELVRMMVDADLDRLRNGGAMHG